MAQERPSNEQKLSNFLSALTERTMTMPEEAFEAELREEGIDPAELTRSANRVFDRVSKDYRLGELHAARARYERHVAEYRAAARTLPGTPETRRVALRAILTSHSTAALGQITAQFRDLTEMSDEDVDSCYRQLLLLGVISPEAAEPEQGTPEAKDAEGGSRD